MNGNGGVPKTPEPSRQLSSPMLDATDGGYRFASAAGCNFCQGATRGAFGETFCRHCGRAFRKARTERASNSIEALGLDEFTLKSAHSSGEWGGLENEGDYMPPTKAGLGIAKSPKWAPARRRSPHPQYA